jgi:DNA-binding transcriptional LysR family regulator
VRFTQQYPRVKVYADLTNNTREFSGLRERKYDCFLQRLPRSVFQKSTIDDLNLELLLDETAVCGAGADSKWARRRKIDLVELINEPWIFGAAETWNGAMVEEIFRGQALSVPKPQIITVSIPTRARLLAAGPYLSIFLGSVVQRLVADHYAVRALPIDLPESSFSTRIVTVKNRTLSPAVERFLVCVREVAASFAGKQRGQRAHSSKSKVS